jgi:predicted transcriptional regulator
MRTTIDLPDDVHRAAMQLARDRHQTFSRTVAGLLRSALAGAHRTNSIEVDQRTGLPTVHVGSRITAEDVAAAVHDD